ncbi:phosphodiesterase I/nucleotide pyrophosphatase beta [Asticcacaulis biprosthecium C19]|uniref:Phosphodiesterase I/nucleotide pyrophosphatase beta n=1 Tax=Asticcacaulis biprosthecium C19 TaxID=715226 RepID=F4QRJ4_9CAUL|nr:ectonucleotide pyrophosphatase/phosphodiesterase [Asticcacaulis biprosthecium]EGF90120.1 phosphodiesterase I/nucleotide pyrophosphatase beta [Asticcacaulis biprosthecium C19]
MPRLFSLILAVLTLAGCASVPQGRGEPPLLVLVSIDGFRADYLERGVTPNLNHLAQTGATGPMRPSFPSLTFPNHYTLVTGLRPDRHGVVNNTMRDEGRPGVTFKMSNKEAVTDAFWWAGGKPVWTSAEEQGVKAATLFWPGSEAPNSGRRPSYWLPFNDDMPLIERITQVMTWIDLPAAQRPGFITLYYSDLDHAGHDFGPDSHEVDSALATVDTSIGQLLDGLKARGLDGKVNIIIVADHGMAKHRPETFVKLAELLPPDSTDVLGGQVAGFTPKPGREAEVEAILLRPHDHMTCWRKADIPKRFRYGRHPRVPNINCLADVGGYIVAPSTNGWMPKPQGGSHGYDPEAIEMRALFIANGPDIKPGVVLEVFDNVDVYSLQMRLLGLKAQPGDGTVATFRRALRGY